MQEQEEKKDLQVPNINFVWFGAFKTSSFEGPRMLANAVNDAAQSYPITYWVEEERLAEARAAWSEHKNVQVKSIEEAIHNYCCADIDKERRITLLLEICKKENLPTIAKELLAPIIQSQSSGYFFDTSIAAAKITNLPMLPLPALPRLLTSAKSPIQIRDQNGQIIPHAYPHTQYKAEKFNLNENEYVSTSSDLFAFFSAADASGAINADSKLFFSSLAENTIKVWETFFNNSWGDSQTISKEDYLNYMREILISPIATLYFPHDEEDIKTIMVLDTNNKKLTAHDASTGMPISAIRKCKFTTIDAIHQGDMLRRLLQPIKTLWGQVDPGQLALFFGGKQTGIQKYYLGSWVRNNFASYLERQIKQIPAFQTKASSEVPSTQQKNEEPKSKTVCNRYSLFNTSFIGAATLVAIGSYVAYSQCTMKVR